MFYFSRDRERERECVIPCLTKTRQQSKGDILYACESLIDNRSRGRTIPAINPEISVSLNSSWRKHIIIIASHHHNIVYRVCLYPKKDNLIQWDEALSGYGRAVAFVMFKLIRDTMSKLSTPPNCPGSLNSKTQEILSNIKPIWMDKHLACKRAIRYVSRYYSRMEWC